MARYDVEAMNGAGQVVKRLVEGKSEGEVAEKVRAAGQFLVKVRVVRVKEAPAGGRRRPGLWRVSFGGPSRRQVAEFLEGFATLQDAGLPIVKSLRVLEEQERPGVMRNILGDVAERVEGGETLSEALGAHPRTFDRLSVNMVRAGETGGVLDVILLRLAEFMDKAQRLKRRVVGAMVYPAAVMGFSMLVVMGIMIFIVPRFQEIFKDFKADLPALTVGLMRVADFLAFQYGWAMVLGVPVAAWGLVKVLGRTEAGRWGMDAGMLRVPILGKILSKTAMARWTRTLGTLLAAGVPILDALAITRETVGNVVFAGMLRKVQEAVREGEAFAAPLKGSRVVPAMAVNMIATGEETGDLDKMLMKIADKHDEQVDVLVGSLMSLLEPVMVVVLGGIVGTIVLALFWPLVAIMDKMAGGGV